MTPKTDSVAVLRAIRSVFDTIPPPCAERDALDAAIAALEAQGEAVAWTMRNAYGERIAMTDDQRAKQPEWVLRKWANAAPLYLHPSLEAQASAPGMPGIDDDTAAYVDPNTRSIHIDWDADPANQLSLIVKRDGSVAFAAYHHGQKTVGNAMGPEFKQAMRLWASAPGGEVTEEMFSRAWRAYQDAECKPYTDHRMTKLRAALTAALSTIGESQ